MKKITLTILVQRTNTIEKKSLNDTNRKFSGSENNNYIVRNSHDEKFDMEHNEKYLESNLVFLIGLLA